MEKKYIDDRVLAAGIPIALAAALCTGQHGMTAIAMMLCIAGLFTAGDVNRKQAITWTALGFGVCLVNWYWNVKGTWADVFLLYGSAALLQQSLDHEKKELTKSWCLWIAVITAGLGIAELLLSRIGNPGVGCLTGVLQSAEAMGLFFAMAVLSDDSLKRRYIFCVALGMTGSVLGFICLGFGLLWKKQDWVEDFVWVIVGLLFLVCPSESVWLLLAIFLFWCIPETHACVGKGSEKWWFVPFVIAVCNPWTLELLKDWVDSFILIVNKPDFHLLFGAGAGVEMMTGGLFQTAVELGLLVGIVFALCAAFVCVKPAGWAWLINILFGACGFVPAPFLLGAGTGMTDIPEEKKTDGRPYFFLLLVMSLYLS